MAFKGRDGPEPYDVYDDELALLGAIKEAEFQSAVVKGIELWLQIREAEAKAAAKAQKTRRPYTRSRRRR